MKIAILGAGAMGNVLRDMIEETEGVTCLGMIEPLNGGRLEDVKEEADVVIDFSNPGNLPMMAEFAEKRKTALVIATTGFSPEQVQTIKEISEKVPVVYAANFSLGITVMRKTAVDLSKALGESFDIEIVEKHHNKKLDSPSGTAKMLANAMNHDGKYEQIYGREGDRKRGKEIGIHAVRGGTIAGAHTILFAGQDEILKLTHAASSKKIFAAGAIQAAKFVNEKKTGLYDMEDVLFS
jgi:4-hydroxy-tetrahydrodipicolinate reductase